MSLEKCSFIIEVDCDAWHFSCTYFESFEHDRLRFDGGTWKWVSITMQLVPAEGDPTCVSIPQGKVYVVYISRANQTDWDTWIVLAGVRKEGLEHHTAASIFTTVMYLSMHIHVVYMHSFAYACTCT